MDPAIESNLVFSHFPLFLAEDGFLEIEHRYTLNFNFGKMLQKRGLFPSTTLFFGIAFPFSLDDQKQKKRRKRILKPTQVCKDKQEDL